MDGSTHSDSISMHEMHDARKPMLADGRWDGTDATPMSGGGHLLHPDDPNNPMSWSVSKKLYASVASTFLTFA